MTERGKKVLVAMSGGVDSSVAAHLLKEEGYKVIGITLKLFCYEDVSEDRNPCCSLEAIEDAKNVCQKLDIPHYVFSVEKQFEKEIINNFIEEYKEGRTPNPCIRCNRFIKFGFLLKKAKELGADFVATGHHVRVKKENGKYRLLRGKDKAKDQSYFLYRINQDILSKSLFPIGEYRKDEIRKMAEGAKLKTAQKPESQEICFVDTTPGEFLEKRIEKREGNIVTKDGKVIGRHEGIFNYTIGQRKGIGGGFEKPMYVVNIDSSKNEVIIGEEGDLYNDKFKIEDTNWVSGKESDSENLQVKIRYQGSLAEVERMEKINDDNYQITIKTSKKAITSGQSAVFYKREYCLGGGIIF